jgi:hypothetical protein
MDELNKQIAEFYEARRDASGVEGIEPLRRLDQIQKGTTLFLPIEGGDSFTVLGVGKVVKYPGMAYVLEGMHVPGHIRQNSSGKFEPCYTGSKEFWEKNMIAEKQRCFQEHLLESIDCYVLNEKV